jgi:hypothetical protein
MPKSENLTSNNRLNNSHPHTDCFEWVIVLDSHDRKDTLDWCLIRLFSHLGLSHYSRLSFGRAREKCGYVFGVGFSERKSRIGFGRKCQCTIWEAFCLLDTTCIKSIEDSIESARFRRHGAIALPDFVGDNVEHEVSSESLR